MSCRRPIYVQAVNLFRLVAMWHLTLAKPVLATQALCLALLNHQLIVAKAFVVGFLILKLLQLLT